MKFSRLVSTALSLHQLIAAPGLAAGPDPRFNPTVGPTLGIKQEISLMEEVHRSDANAALFDLMAGRMRDMRSEASGLRSGPRRHEAQYLDALILAKFPTIYDLLFEDQKKKAFESEVVGIKLSTLFDGFMEMVEKIHKIFMTVIWYRNAKHLIHRPLHCLSNFRKKSKRTDIRRPIRRP